MKQMDRLAREGAQVTAARLHLSAENRIIESERIQTHVHLMNVSLKKKKKRQKKVLRPDLIFGGYYRQLFSQLPVLRVQVHYLTKQREI